MYDSFDAGGGVLDPAWHFEVGYCVSCCEDRGEVGGVCEEPLEGFGLGLELVMIVDGCEVDAGGEGGESLVGDVAGEVG